MGGFDFNNHYVFPIEIGNYEFWVTESLIVSFFICCMLVLIALVVRFFIGKPKKIPAGVQNVMEFIVELLDNFTVSSMGEKCIGFSSFYGSMFIYIIVSNLAGLFLGPVVDSSGAISFGFMRPPTADLAVTFSLAILTFFMIHYFAIRAKGVGSWLKGFTEPMWLLTPINLIGEISTPISLGFRLFGNVLGGTIIIGLYYAMLPVWALLGIPIALHGYFDVFAGALQAFIFVMLSMTFVSNAMDD